MAPPAYAYWRVSTGSIEPTLSTSLIENPPVFRLQRAVFRRKITIFFHHNMKNNQKRKEKRKDPPVPLRKGKKEGSAKMQPRNSVLLLLVRCLVVCLPSLRLRRITPLQAAYRRSRTLIPSAEEGEDVVPILLSWECCPESAVTRVLRRILPPQNRSFEVSSFIEVSPMHLSRSSHCPESLIC